MLWPVLGLEKLADQVVVDLLPRDVKVADDDWSVVGQFVPRTSRVRWHC